MKIHNPKMFRSSGVQVSVDAGVIGGGGHVGFPLAIMLSSRGVNTAIYDISKLTVAGINAIGMPFWKPEAEKLLQEFFEAKNLSSTTGSSVTGETDSLIMVRGVLG